MRYLPPEHGKALHRSLRRVPFRRFQQQAVGSVRLGRDSLSPLRYNCQNSVTRPVKVKIQGVCQLHRRQAAVPQYIPFQPQQAVKKAPDFLFRDPSSA